MLLTRTFLQQGAAQQQEEMNAFGGGVICTALRSKIIIMQPCESAKASCGKEPGEIRRRGEVGGRLSPAEPDAGATASARDMKRLISMVCPTHLPTLQKKRKIEKKSLFMGMGIRLVLRIMFAVVWSSQLTSGSLLPFELRKLHVFRINGLEMVR